MVLALAVRFRGRAIVAGAIGRGVSHLSGKRLRGLIADGQHIRLPSKASGQPGDCFEQPDTKQWWRYARFDYCSSGQGSATQSDEAIVGRAHAPMSAIG